MPVVEQKRSTRKIAFKLSEKEIVDQALQAAAARVEITKLEVQRKQISDDFKKKIKEKEGALAECFAIIQSGEVEKPTEVIDKYNYEDMVVTTYFADGRSTEPIAERVMSDEERQLSIHAVRNDPQQDLFDGPDNVLPFNPPHPSPINFEHNVVNLDDFNAELAEQEQYVQASEDKPTLVKHYLITWKLEAGEGALFRRKTIDLHGADSFMWERVGEPSVLGEAAPAVESPEQPAEQPAGVDF